MLFYQGETGEKGEPGSIGLPVSLCMFLSIHMHGIHLVSVASSGHTVILVKVIFHMCWFCLLYKA